jgi:hypothetical protein
MALAQRMKDSGRKIQEPEFRDLKTLPSWELTPGEKKKLADSALNEPKQNRSSHVRKEGRRHSNSKSLRHKSESRKSEQPKQESEKKNPRDTRESLKAELRPDLAALPGKSFAEGPRTSDVKLRKLKERIESASNRDVKRFNWAASQIQSMYMKKSLKMRARRTILKGFSYPR